MNMNNESSTTFQLPDEVLEICSLAEDIVKKELLPIESEYLASPNHAFGLKETINIESVFGKEKLDHLIKISKDTGLWNLLIPEEH